MSDLHELERCLERELSAAENQRRNQEDPLRRAIVEREQRHEQLMTLTHRLLQAVLRPRMEKLAEYFTHATVALPDDNRCVLHLRPTLRFPVTARFEIAVSHDAPCATLIVLSHFEILPVYFPFEGSTWLTLPLGRANEDTVAGWVNERALHFLRTYLRIEAADQLDTKHMVSDPVCGLHINPLYAAAQSQFEGQVYSFCHADCFKKFVANPRQYLGGVDLPVSPRIVSLPVET